MSVERYVIFVLLVIYEKLNYINCLVTVLIFSPRCSLHYSLLTIEEQFFWGGGGDLKTHGLN